MELQRFCISNNTITIVDDAGKKQPLPRYYRKKFGYEMNTENIKTQLDNIEKMAGKPILEIPPKLLSKYKATLFMRDFEKRMKKYNCQNEF